MSKKVEERYFSVDIETCGPVPGLYSMLSLGACIVGDVATSFYQELKPITLHHDIEALTVTGFSMEQQMRNGIDPIEVMGDFSTWVLEKAGDFRPIFVGFNAAFDWSFINWYFHFYATGNPFGHAPLDIKSFMMAVTGCKWSEARSSRAAELFSITASRKHNALADAILQAEILMHLLMEKEMRY